jgi:hypothetical protein
MMDHHSSEDILFAYSVEPCHDQQTLESYLRQYPDLAQELIDLSHELRLAETLGPSDVGLEPDAAWQEAWQQYFACEPNTADTSIDPFAQFKGQEFAFLADSLAVPRSFLIALRDRLVDPTSIPLRFLLRFSEFTGASIDGLRRYFARPPALSGALSFKADNKPHAQDQVTFEALVRSTNLTDEQREALQRDIDDNGHD